MESEGEKKSGQTNRQLRRAHLDKNDEFYTRRESVEEELWHYRSHFRGAVVYCNCDDPKVSEFWRYFRANFHELELRCVIATCYKNQNPDMFSPHDCDRAARLEYDGKKEIFVPLQSDGDFRKRECIDLLRRADIVCTNPPFSLFREYVAQLVAENKKFLILGNMNAVSYRDIFRLIHGGKLWLGNKPMGVDMLFNVPPGFAAWLRENKKEGSAYKIVGGVILGRSSAIWFTNLDHKKRHENLTLTAHYGGGMAYPKYDYYDAIEVRRVVDIPQNYAGVMGVPLSFLDKWNPDQFEIIDAIGRYSLLSGPTNETKGKYLTKVNGVPKFVRVLIRKK